MREQERGEAETRKSLAEGHGITFPNAEEAIKWLKGKDKMTEQELRKGLTDLLVIVSGYPKLPEQVQGYIDDIMTLIKEAGYVKLAEDQTAPEHRFTVMGYPVSVDIAHYAREAGWRKVILESK